METLLSALSIRNLLTVLDIMRTVTGTVGSPARSTTTLLGLAVSLSSRLDPHTTALSGCKYIRRYGCPYTRIYTYPYVNIRETLAVTTPTG